MTERARLPALLLALLLPLPALGVQVTVPEPALTGVTIEVVVEDAAPAAQVELSLAGKRYQAVADNEGTAIFEALPVEQSGSVTVTVSSGGVVVETGMRVLPGWVSLLPALTAILVALLIRNVVPALIVGLWLGATALNSFTAAGAGKGLLDVFQVFVTDALADPDHAAVILFTMMIGGLVGIVTRNGGMIAVVEHVVSRARTVIGGQLAVWLMGLVIFFDDYANTLVVGNTARPITDHLKISREKLAYIVDSTAAPVVSIALITTWIGYEVSLIDDALAGIDGLSDYTAYGLFLNSIPYSFYPILAIFFVFIVAWTGRDIGPMLRAEERARRGETVALEAGSETINGETLDAKPDAPARAINALLPIGVMIVALAVGLYVTGEGDTLTDILGSSDPYKAMMWAAFIAVLVAAVMTFAQRILDAHEIVDAWYGGARATLFGMIVLVLAWSMAAVTNDLNAKGFLIASLGDSLPVALVPATVFVLAAVTAFATGTSWGTMGILVPLVVPLAWAVMTVNGMHAPSDMHILYSSIACCLAGAVWGDHCSPISDTTVLSSIASGCNHIEHVRTQLPYALLTGIVAVGIGTIPGGFGIPPWISLLVGAAVLFAVLRLLGRRARATEAES